MSFGVAGGTKPGNPNNDYEVPNSPNDGVSSISWSPTSNLMVAGSWNNQVLCWDVQKSGNNIMAQPKASITHTAPVLCTAFSGDGSTVFSGSCDKTAKMWPLGQAGSQGQQIAAHDAPIKCITHVKEMNLVLTGSWDKTLKYWDTRQPTPAHTIALPERCYAIDCRYPLLIVATAERHILIYDLTRPQQAFKQIVSPLKYQTRCVASFPDKTGFAVGSIEGRVAIQHIEQRDQKNNFAFKCHREMSKVSTDTEIYAVNSIAFHPLGTFATAGSDGSFHFWDKDSKQRLKQFQRCNQSITCGAFNTPGDIYAYAVSYDWSKGAERHNPNSSNQILLHPTTEAEIKQRNKTNRR